jgi:hypothetical protein
MQSLKITHLINANSNQLSLNSSTLYPQRTNCQLLLTRRYDSNPQHPLCDAHKGSVLHAEF